MKPVFIAAALFFAFCLVAGEAHAAQGYRIYAHKLLSNLPAGVAVRPDLETYLDRLAVAARRKAGKPPLKPDPLLRQAARAQALDMLKANRLSHSSASGYNFRQRVEAFGGFELGDFGENGARDRQRGAVDKRKARRLFQQWLDSSGHRKNMMNRYYNYVSTGAVQVGHHLYAVQMFWER